jgi:hypothetical protein
MTANYKNLTTYLESADLVNNAIRLTFEKIEEIIGDELPAEAHEFRTWWSNQKSANEPQKSGWLDAGFIVIKAKFSENYIDFLKI